MWAESLLCSKCHEALNPLLRACPRCGQEVQLKPLPVSAGKSAPSPQNQPWQGEVVFVTPLEKAPALPRFTTPRLILMAVGIGLVVFSTIVAFLLWQQQQREQAQLAETQARERALRESIAITPTPDARAELSNDKTISEAIGLALAAYDPMASARYKFQTQDGIVTLDGYVLTQTERSGTENIIRAIAGVRMLCSNLVVAPEPVARVLPPMMKSNLPAASRLDEALLKYLPQNERQSEAAPPPPPATPDPQREAERQRREAELTRLREEETALRRQAEARIRNEAAEYERRQEELRRAEAERRARAEQARAEVSALRSGTVAWSGQVEGIDEIVINGSSATVRHVSGDPARDARASFSAPVPRAPISVKLLSVNGRGAISIVQEPSAANGYVTIVRVDDSRKGGDKRYEFTLRWSAQ
jgi:hypothetical protein